MNARCDEIGANFVGGLELGAVPLAALVVATDFTSDRLGFMVRKQAKGRGGRKTNNPPDAESRIKKNIEEGRGFRLMDGIKKGGSGNFDFASSNSLWRASLDTIDFMPLPSSIFFFILDSASGGN